ncbi:MAG: TIGR00645 family protein [Proteobacteria bacterium]|nr:TIGR00645 family protein [Pseudomonadota bacterium]
MNGQKPQFIELAIERVLFASRWLLAPFYLGMVVALGAILVVFVNELVHGLAEIAVFDAEHVILLALSLIDLSLTGNLVLIVIFAGYETFVSRMHVGDHEDRPAWMGTVDFSDLKIKLIASIVAISGIALLRVFLPLGDTGVRVEQPRLGWMIGIHVTFVVSGVLMAVMDRISGKDH